MARATGALAAHHEAAANVAGGPGTASPCLLDEAATWTATDTPRLPLAAHGLSLALQDNRHADNGEFNGITEVRLPGRQHPLGLHVWNFENVFDGVQHQNNADPKVDHLFEPRQATAPVTLGRLREGSGVIYQPATPFWGIESATKVTIAGPTAVDVEFAARLTRPTPMTSWFGLFWASYPARADMPLNFPGRQNASAEPRWIEGRSQHHLVRNTWLLEGSGAPIRFVPGYPDKLWTTMAEGVETWVAPLAYGKVDEETTFAMLLSSAQGLRVTQSPLSAWDAQMIVHGWEVGACVTLRARLLFGELSPEDVVRAYEEWSGKVVGPLGTMVASQR